MKILYFTNKPAPYRVEFFNRLNKDNDLTVLFDYNERDHRNPLWYKNNKYEFKYFYIKKFGYFQLKKLLKNEKYDIVVIGTYASLNGAFFNILLRKLHIKFFVNADGGFIPKKESFISKFLKHHFLSTATYYLSSGKETNKYFIYYGAKENEIFNYHFSSLNESDILEKPIPYKKKLEMRSKAGFKYKRLFISVGSFIHVKAYDLFLDAIKNEQYKNTGFLIIGGGKDRVLLENIIKENNLTNVHLIDFCTKDVLIKYYQMSDVFFFNSRGDVWGLVINEAMANGLPVISSDTAIASLELVSKENLYHFDDYEEIRKHIKKYINIDENELYDEGLHNLNIIKDYTIKNTVNEHLEIFDNVMKRSK